jgi:hypothetical protein
MESQPVDSMVQQEFLITGERFIPAFGINRHIGRRWLSSEESKSKLEMHDDSHKLYSKEAMKVAESIQK